MINRRAVVFACLALLFGAGGAYANLSWLRSQSPEPVTRIVELQPETTRIVVARGAVPAGHALRPDELESVEWPAAMRPRDSFAEPRELVGRVSGRAIGAGEPLVASALLPKGTLAGLSPIIAEGHRAVAVKVDEVIGIAGFVKPGARVDVLATIRTRGGDREAFANVILQDTRVLAIDQSLEESDPADPPALVSVVTLEVTPEEAERLTFSAHEGRLQLALRNPSDGDRVSTKSVSARSLRGAKTTPRRRARKGVEVVKGLDVSKRFF